VLVGNESGDLFSWCRQHRERAEGRKGGQSHDLEQ
jgi:hypothetical protein